MIVLNGQPREHVLPASVGALVRDLGLPADARGVAVAVDGEVVRRADWDSYEIADGARVEVLTAMQGG